ncbi:toprim domain-containing protein [Motilibacter aurantiacus]|uniref:toprim domain-containing protein n=1 Tax=Motilibacter aurantiacus TaxID=2714955 RepID=UPI001407A166|nr:toprim domain-containing protein [Motilibacter aurantiacus]NHC47153.1 hypothetical protein [Motilibacter aurantiacus]
MSPTDHAQLYAMHDQARRFYTRGWGGAKDRDVARFFAEVERRGVTTETFSKYQVGYAAPSWTALTNHLRGLGYTNEQLLESGLGMKTSRNTVVDRFRDRVMFPITSAAPAGELGRVVGFSGQSLDPRAGAEGAPPRYLDSPVTPIYRKGEHTFGLGSMPELDGRAAGATPVLVEGRWDVLAVTSTDPGSFYGVAPGGTALTQHQANLLAASATGRGLIVAPDEDEPGRAAAIAAYPLLRAAGLHPDRAPGVPGHDPSDLLGQYGPSTLAASLRAAATRPLVAAVLEDTMSRYRDRLQWPEGRVAAARAVAPILADLPPGVASWQMNELASAHGLDHDLLMREYLAVDAGGADARGRADSGEPSTQPLTNRASAASLTAAAYPAPLSGAPSLDTAPPATPAPAPATAQLAASGRRLQ